MKRPRRHVLLIATAIAIAGAAIFGCAHPQRRNDWRNTAQRCVSDGECPSGKCAMELGASEGTCTPSTLPGLPPGGGRHAGDGGTHPPGPGPSIQPSSSDIQI